MPSAALELKTWAEWRAFVFVKVNVVAKRLYQTSAYSTEKSILKTGVEHKKVCQTALQVEIRIRIHAAQKAACCELLLPQFFPPRPRPCPLLRARAGIQDVWPRWLGRWIASFVQPMLRSWWSGAVRLHLQAKNHSRFLAEDPATMTCRTLGPSWS